MIAAILTFISGSLGCGKVPEYTADDIQSVSVSCGHMDYSFSYSFYLRKNENEWLLDAEFSKDAEQPRIKYEERQIAEEDVKELLDIAADRKVIEKIRRYKKPKINVMVSDETTYFTSILFADGERLGAAALISKEMEDCFYRLADTTKTESMWR